MHIDSYKFGFILIDNIPYTKDLIICRHKIRQNWRRQIGHVLHMQDIESFIDEEEPEILIVGTGKFGRMSVLPETLDYLKNKGIECIAQSTDLACEKFNELVDAKKVVGAFHLTC